MNQQLINREKELIARIQAVASLHAGRWNKNGRIERVVSSLKSKLEEIWAKQRLAQSLERIRRGVTERIRTAMRSFAEYWAPIAFRILRVTDRRKAGIVLGLGRKIAAGKNTWRQFVFFEALLSEVRSCDEFCVIER